MDPIEHLIWHYLKQHLLPKEVAADLLACLKTPKPDLSVIIENDLPTNSVALLKGSFVLVKAKPPYVFSL